MNLVRQVKRIAATGSFALSMVATKALANTGTQVNNGFNQFAGDANAGDTTLNQYISTIINVLLGAIGVVAVIMLIIGGFRYVFSQGDETATKGAKDTILYALIGIVVAVLAFSIVNFVITPFTNQT